MRQEITQHGTSGSSTEAHASHADMAELSGYLSAMAIIVGLIIAWICLCGI